MDAETCIACGVAFVSGDRYLPDNSGGAIHFDCCGPERESYCNADGDPLGPDEAIPEPQIWRGENERFYDEQIAPELARLGKLCEARGLPFLAHVEFDQGHYGTTAAAPATRSWGFTLALYAATAKGNFDALAFAVAKHVRENNTGHGSLILKQMGVPTSPAQVSQGPTIQ